jgi:diguanylate cyclase (GGDEF)-like protein/PAS domain S-box-containing protein
MGINKLLGKRLVRLMSKLKQPFGRGRRELITASCVAICILMLRYGGLLQSLEFAALDRFFRFRPNDPPEERITIVAVDEASLRQVGSWPIPDDVIAELLQKLQVYKPRAIGLDIYRDLPVGSGHQALVDVYRTMPNLVGIQLLANNQNASVPPPPILNQLDQVGVNNVLFDSDGKVRRSLLYWHVYNKAHESFALKLAKLYLKAENIVPKEAPNKYMQLGKAIFPRFQPSDGGYVGAVNGGYQFISNFPKPVCKRPEGQNNCRFNQVFLRDVMANRVKEPENLFSDRIILIGSIAPSLQDFVLIPYSSTLMGTAQPVAGVELQAYFTSELISAALQGRPLIKVWNDLFESFWIFALGYMGVALTWRIQRPIHSSLIILLFCCVLIGFAYVNFLFGWWVPIVPSLLTFCISAIAITYQIAYSQQELKRSKHFLDRIINTIPDPVFVKNEHHQWIVLNEAYCEFIGYPKEMLLERSDYDFFPKQEADVFRKQDELVFHTQEHQEHEEEFTDATGQTHLIATKRSLHKDAAGNFFLVGVIRDITQRKLLEDELKRTAAELYRSNNELKLKEDHLRYLAYHDSLTGLSNRKFFAEQFHESVQWAQSHNLLLGLLFIDLDGFKQVNDTLGHEMGDRLLVTVAQRLSNTLRGSDTVSRLGGDEFTIILRALPNVKVAAKVAEKILANITEPIILDGYTTRISASIGISIYPANSQDTETLIKQADTAMYRAKHLGKNRYEFA